LPICLPRAARLGGRPPIPPEGRRTGAVTGSRDSENQDRSRIASGPYLPPTTHHPPLATRSFRLPTSAFRLPASAFRLPTSAFRLPTSAFSLRLPTHFVTDRLYSLTDSGTKIPRITTIQISVYSSGFCIDHASDVAANGLVLPNNSRAAWVTADTGFHSAKIRSGVGRFSAGTKALEMNVSGMITMKEALLITSTLGTRRPTVAITHEKP